MTSESPLSSEEMLRRARESARSPEPPEVERVAVPPPEPESPKVAARIRRVNLRADSPRSAPNPRAAVVAAVSLLILGIVAAALVAMVASSP